MKASTPFGRHPFRFDYVEAKDGEVAVMGTVAGLPSGVVFERRDLALAAAVVVLGVGVLLRSRRCGYPERERRRRRSSR